MGCDAVLRVSTLDPLLVFTKSHLERPFGLPNVGSRAFFTGDLVDHSPLPILRNAGLDSHQGLSEGLCWLEHCLDPKGNAYHLQLFTESSNVGETHDLQWVLTHGFRGRGKETRLTGECLLYQIFGESVGLENTLEVLEFRLFSTSDFLLQLYPG